MSNNSREKIINKLTETTQCTEDSKLVLDGCLEKYVEDQIKCKLPWGTPPTGNSCEYLNISSNLLKRLAKMVPDFRSCMYQSEGLRQPCQLDAKQRCSHTDRYERLPSVHRMRDSMLL